MSAGDCVATSMHKTEPGCTKLFCVTKDVTSCFSDKFLAANAADYTEPADAAREIRVIRGISRLKTSGCRVPVLHRPSKVLRQPLESVAGLQHAVLCSEEYRAGNASGRGAEKHEIGGVTVSADDMRNHQGRTRRSQAAR